MQFNKYYRTLDVELTASTKEIRQAFRKLAHKYHPDISKQPNCENLFKGISEAYVALRTSNRNPVHFNWYDVTKRINFKSADSMRE